MVHLVWIGDGSSLSAETRSLFDSGIPLVRGVSSHPAFETLATLGYRFTEGLENVESRAIVYPGDGPETALPLYQLVQVADRLLGPGGCPWDQEQTHQSLKKYLLEETYEALEAIDSGSDVQLKEELGDLMLQPVMHSAMKKAAGRFDIDEVANEIVLKLVRRHPHVFGEISVTGADEVLQNWDAIKRTEKGSEPQSVLAGVPKGMASLLRAHEISKRAARSGFEWPDIEAVFDKLHEEEAELREAIESGDAEHVESEVGDLLFTAVNIARWAGVEPEEALRRMLDRFTKRFMAMESATDVPLCDLSPEAWDVLWEEAKRAK